MHSFSKWSRANKSRWVTYKVSRHSLKGRYIFLAIEWVLMDEEYWQGCSEIQVIYP